jgi:carboxyl-terminal processing protease
MTGQIVRFAAVCMLAAVLQACGGGGDPSGTTASGSGSSSTSGSTGTTSASGWVAGQFAASSTYAGRCVAPRAGTDAATGTPYPDVQGTALDEKNWLRSWTNELYLWYSEVPDQDPGTFSSDAAYFAVLKTTGTTASGNPKDKFHFTYSTSTWESLSQSGVSAGYGATFSVLASTPPRNVVIAYTEPSSPAALSPASLARGAKILTIDGVDLVNATDTASVNTLNAGLSPATVGETHTFGVMDAGATSSRTVTLTSANVTSTPVQNVKSISTTAGSVGYMLFNDHLATSEAALLSAFSSLKASAVTDLVLDIRYNGGGYLDIASEVAYMVAGAGPTAGQTFELTQFNSKYPTVDPVTHQAIAPLGFHSTTQGFSVTAGQPLPTLNLGRVFVLTGPGTCSASESIINSLRGVNVQVIQIGSTTCGKPYGFYPQDNCGVTYFSIEFQGVNAKGFGNYPDGFSPANATTNIGVSVQGCYVADDLAHQLGDPAEARLAAALSYRSSGSCPAQPTGVGLKRAQVPGLGYLPPEADGEVLKSPWQQNRIVRSLRTVP